MASPLDDLERRKLTEQLDLVIVMLARQQDLLATITSRVKRTQGQNLKAQNKKLRVQLAQQKQAYSELANFMKVEMP